MASRDTYLLQIYRGRAVSGRQWAARLTHVPGGASVRFSDPEALLGHLRALIEQAEVPRDTPAGNGGAETSAEKGRCHPGS